MLCCVLAVAHKTCWQRSLIASVSSRHVSTRKRTLIRELINQSILRLLYLASTSSTQSIQPLSCFLLDQSAAHQAAIYFARLGWAPRHRPSAIEQRCNVACTLTFDRHSSNTSNTTATTTTAPPLKETTKKPRNNIRPLHVPNPIGLAAGFDKDGIIIQPLLDMGFGSVEIGTVTPEPQPGNPKPRLFRLVEHGALINRYGFNSSGADAVETNLRDYCYHNSTSALGSSGGGGVVGINLGKNRDSVTADQVVADYQRLIRQLGPLANYLVINISSPNTAGLRDWQTDRLALQQLLQACLDERDRLANNNESNNIDNKNDNSVPPLFVKLAPDLTDQQLSDIAQTCLQVGMDGLVVSNTTNQRPEDLIRHHNEPGGLSGTPLKDKSTHCIRVLYAAVQGQIPIIGVGGVSTGVDAYEKIRAGASLVQIYSTLVYQGPGVVSRIRHELAQHILTFHGSGTSVMDLVGLDHDDLIWAQLRRQQRQQLDRLQQQQQQQPSPEFSVEHEELESPSQRETVMARDNCDTKTSSGGSGHNTTVDDEHANDTDAADGPTATIPNPEAL